MKQKHLPLMIILVVLQFAITACGIKLNYYTDGPMTKYVTQPVPKLDRPIARTFSLEKVNYQTAASMKGTMISDLVAREIFILPAKVGREVDQLLQMDAEFSREATLDALKVIAKNRDKARRDAGSSVSQSTPSRPSSTSPQSVRYYETKASEAYKKGDYFSGNLYNTTATSMMSFNQTIGQAQSAMSAGFSVLGAVKGIHYAQIKKYFNNLHDWIEHKSGAIGPEAPEGTHLCVFFLNYFDARKFQIESRSRVAVLLVLLDQKGKTNMVLEGSDVYLCKEDCHLYKLKPTAKPLKREGLSKSVEKEIWTPKGTSKLHKDGFDLLNGTYLYLLFQHGLNKLSQLK